MSARARVHAGGEIGVRRWRFGPITPVHGQGTAAADPQRPVVRVRFPAVITDEPWRADSFRHFLAEHTALSAAASRRKTR